MVAISSLLGMNALKKSFIWGLVIPIPAILITALASIWYFVPPMITGNVIDGAVHSAEETANQFKTVRGYYTKNVIKKALASKALTPSYNHKNEKAGIPLPATVIHDLSALLEERDTKVRLYSPFPFPNRAERKLDDFQKEAWDAVNANPDAPYVRQEKDAEGRTVVRVGIADRMVAQACVGCHNSRADTPKDDWKLNDIRGVLEVAMVIDRQLAAGAAVSNRIVTGGTVVTIAIICIMVALLLWLVARPLRSLCASMGKLAEGDNTVEVPMVHRSDEIGQMAGTVQVFKDNMIERARLQDEQREAEQKAVQAEREREQEKRTAEKKAAQEKRAAEEKAAQERRQAMLDLADSFEAQVMGLVNEVSGSAEQLQSNASVMSSASETAAHQAGNVAAASEQATNNVQTVASAAEELSASINEIGEQVTKSSMIAQKAVDETQRSNETVQGLAEAAQKIGDVVSLINDIAAQTNLLALNATIEAARAGDAGKGFAVVASEVKSLATQTAQATEEIAAQISSMQGVTGDAVTAIGSITTTIEEINEIAGGIAAAVEEQGAATQEIARNTQEASKGTQDVSQNITGVNSAVGEAGQVAQQVLSASGELTTHSDALRKEVENFLKTVRTA